MKQVTLFNRDGKVRTYLESLTHDNMGSSERPIAPMLRKLVLPVARKEFRTTAFPPGLTEIEEKYLERLEWPKGMYQYSGFQTAVAYYESVPDLEAPSNLLVDSFSHPWCGSSAHDIDLNLDRNRRSMSHGGGFPLMGSKRDNLNEAMLYNEKVKTSSALEDCWSILPGFRAQKPTEPGTDPVVRLVFGTPTHWWLLECEAFDDAITRTVLQSQALDTDINTFYYEANDLKKYINSKFPSVNEWIGFDFTRFDTSNTASMIRKMVEYFCPNYEFRDLIVEYLNRALVIMPEREVSRA